MDMKKAGKKLIGILLALALALQPLPTMVRAAGETTGETTTEKSVKVPVFSHESGNYKNAFDLTLSAEPGTTVYYSTDGSDPTPEDIAGSGDGGAGDTNLLTSEECHIPVTYANVGLADSAEYSETGDGVVIEPTSYYHNISFTIPTAYTKIAKVKALHVVARIDEISEPTQGNRVKLQTAIIKRGATSSWEEADGTRTRLNGTDQSEDAIYSKGGGFVDYTFQLGVSSMSSAGFVMVGAGNVQTTGGYITKMTVKDIYFEIDLKLQAEADKLSSAQVFQYEDKISVHDRTGEANVLATAINSDKFAQDKSYRATDDQVAKSTVIRAVAVDADGNCSPVVTKTYFVGTNQTTRYSGVPVFSLATDPKNLTDDETGIFVTGNYENYNQHGSEWEREAYVDFYDVDGKIDFATNIGIRVHGGYTRKFQQKSLNIYFREEYGQKNLKYELIPGATNYEGTEKTKKYKNFMLRNGGNDALLTKMRDVFIQSLVEDRKMSVQSSRPCILYLNGEYWGVYNIQEKYGDNWLEEEFGVDKNNIVMIKNGEVDEGQDTDIQLFDELKALSELDMSQPENYQKFLDAVDLQSYLDYHATEVLIGNRDWGWEQNTECWRSRTVTNNKYEDGKWRWMLYDTEFSMNLYGQNSGDTIERMSEEGTTANPLFVALLQNAEFRQKFVNTAMDLLNENFNYTKQKTKYEAMKSVYEVLMVEQNARFGNDWGGNDMGAFDSSTKAFESAWEAMQSRVEGMLKAHCSVSNTSSVSVSTNLAQAADIRINTLSQSLEADTGWTGTYFKEIPLSLEASEISGYEFEKWEVTGGSVTNVTSRSTMLTLTGKDVSVKAIYKKGTEVPTPTPGGSDPTATPGPSTPGESDPTVTPGPSTPGASTPGASDPTVTPGVSTPGASDPTVTQGTSDPTAAPGDTDEEEEFEDDEENGVPQKVVIKKVSSPKKKAIKIWIKKMSVDGYEIVYAKNKKFTKSKKQIRTKKTIITIKKLKPKKTYYVKVRAYHVNEDGKRVYGKFSKVKRIQVK